ncbi:hypothetical protein PsorP6_011456 [Peronosclerospora sorghi]|uniref:Uncharacterized protein n=1 Tax=Peronosclerospora sorghi TaxID=230839 RepID=A0ACC0WJL0_9STRA|nr:hypothetical protein PsorP6_011456 [Peronosclerospora sorghi]
MNLNKHTNISYHVRHCFQASSIFIPTFVRLLSYADHLCSSSRHAPELPQHFVGMNVQVGSQKFPRNMVLLRLELQLLQ